MGTSQGSAGVCRQDSSIFSSTCQITSAAAGRQRLPVPGDAGQNRTAPPAGELVGSTIRRCIRRITARHWPLAVRLQGIRTGHLVCWAQHHSAQGLV